MKPFFKSSKDKSRGGGKKFDKPLKIAYYFNGLLESDTYSEKQYIYFTKAESKITGPVLYSFNIDPEGRNT